MRTSLAGPWGKVKSVVMFIHCGPVCHGVVFKKHRCLVVGGWVGNNGIVTFKGTQRQ